MIRRADPSGHRPGEFAQARARAALDTRTLRARAVRTVTGKAVSDDDRTRLLSMLGLEEDTQATKTSDTIRPVGREMVSLRELEGGLGDYVRAVAAELGVPAEATGFEISDTMTAYLGLPDRRADCPGRDLMLTWNARDGWLVAVETNPAEPVHVLGRLGGTDLLPHPHAVARFVTTLLGRHRSG